MCTLAAEWCGLLSPCSFQPRPNIRYPAVRASYRMLALAISINCLGPRAVERGGETVARDSAGTASERARREMLALAIASIRSHSNS